MQFTTTMKIVTAGLIAAIIIVLYSLFTIEKQSRISAELERDQAIEQRDSLITLNQKQVEKIHSFNDLSAKHAKEMSDAQTEIDDLRTKLRDGPTRLYVKADCPAASGTDKTGSLGDAGTARLSQAARNDYLRLRQMMAENLQQTRYLQDYIRTQCAR